MQKTQRPNGKTTRLEYMLAAWEDVMFVAELRARRAKATKLANKFRINWFDGKGGFNNWRSFRSYLLNAVSSGGNKNVFNWELYGSRGDPFSTLISDSCTIDQMLLMVFPEQIHCWMGESRRVFSLSSDLQRLIAATSLDDVKLGDLHFPFDSFMVELPEPILGKAGNRYDVLLFARHSSRTESTSLKGSCLLIPERVKEYAPLSLTRKRELTKFADRKKWDSLARKLKSAERDVLKYHDMHTLFVWHEAHLDRPVTEHVREYTREMNSQMTRQLPESMDEDAEQQALRILAGLCLYVRTLPPVSKCKSDWQVVDPSLAMPVVAITKESKVCMLSTEFTLSPEEREIFGSREVSEELTCGTRKNPHFRRGFWKRPSGQGSNPLAEKTIWVRPTIVNRHLLSEGQLPLGAKNILLSSGSQK